MLQGGRRRRRRVPADRFLRRHVSIHAPVTNLIAAIAGHGGVTHATPPAGSSFVRIRRDTSSHFSGISRTVNPPRILATSPLPGDRTRTDKSTVEIFLKRDG